MDAISAANQIANSQVVWSILCILLAGYVLWHSNKREGRLLESLEKLTEAQQEISHNLRVVEGRMDRMEKHTYRAKGDE